MIGIETEYFPAAQAASDPLARRAMILATVKIAVLIEPSATHDGKGAIKKGLRDLEDRVSSAMVDAIPKTGQG